MDFDTFALEPNLEIFPIEKAFPIEQRPLRHVFAHSLAREKEVDLADATDSAGSNPKDSKEIERPETNRIRNF